MHHIPHTAVRNLESGQHVFPHIYCKCTLTLPWCSCLRESLHLSVLCASSLFSLPAAFTALLRVVDPRQNFQPSRLEGGSLLGAAPRPQTSLHTRTQHCTTLGPDLSALPRLRAQTHTTHSLLSLSPLSLCAFIATHPLHTSPEHAGRINGPSGKSWRVVGERGGRAGGEGVCVGYVKEKEFLSSTEIQRLFWSKSVFPCFFIFFLNTVKQVCDGLWVKLFYRFLL